MGTVLAIVLAYNLLNGNVGKAAGEISKKLKDKKK